MLDCIIEIVAEKPLFSCHVTPLRMNKQTVIGSTWLPEHPDTITICTSLVYGPYLCTLYVFTFTGPERLAQESVFKIGGIAAPDSIERRVSQR